MINEKTLQIVGQIEEIIDSINMDTRICICLSFLIFEIIYLVYAIVVYENKNNFVFDYLLGLFVLTLCWIMYIVKS